jgi:hypothetical protein
MVAQNSTPRENARASWPDRYLKTALPVQTPAHCRRIVTSKRRPSRRPPGHHAASPSLPGRAAQDGEAGHEPGAAWQGGGRPGHEIPPELIAGRLKVDSPDHPEMQVSTETIDLYRRVV